MRYELKVTSRSTGYTHTNEFNTIQQLKDYIFENDYYTSSWSYVVWDNKKEDTIMSK